MPLWQTCFLICMVSGRHPDPSDALPTLLTGTPPWFLSLSLAFRFPLKLCLVGRKGWGIAFVNCWGHTTLISLVIKPGEVARIPPSHEETQRLRKTKGPAQECSLVASTPAHLLLASRSDAYLLVAPKRMLTLCWETSRRPGGCSGVLCGPRSRAGAFLHTPLGPGTFS